MIIINAMEVDRIEKEFTGLLLRENKELDTPLRWHDDIEKVFGQIGEAMEELKNHPDGADRLAYFSDTVFSLLLSRQIKFSLSSANYQSTIDKMFFDAAKSSALQIVGMFGKNAVPHQNEEKVTGVSEIPKLPEPPIVAESRSNTSFSDIVLVRIVKENVGTAEKPMTMVIFGDRSKPDGVEYKLRTGDLITVPTSHANTLIERGFATPVNIDLEAS